MTDSSQRHWLAVSPHLDVAIEDLPRELREPIVLYFLEGRGRAEVARELGLSSRLLSARLRTGVWALHAKLAQAGVTVPASALAALLTENAVVEPPPALVASLMRIALPGAGRSARGGTGAARGTPQEQPPLPN